MSMSYYTAPMEGITGYLFRKTYHELFGMTYPQGMPSKYFMPFISPQQDGSWKSKDKKDTAPENNQCIPAIPQILSNHAESFILTAKRLKDMGYEEVNLNLGCPYPTVVSKGKGSGFLAYPDRLEAFLDQVFREQDLPAVSIKTRLAPADQPEINERIFAIYEQYPISELIVHPRRQKDMYKGVPDLPAFARITEHSRHKLCYNGNLYTPEDIRMFAGEYQGVDTVMVGRGLLRNPALLRMAEGGQPLTREEFVSFHDRLYQAYRETLSGPGAVLGRMKELWVYWETLLAESPKVMKTVYKAKRWEEYERAAETLMMDMCFLEPNELPRVTAKLNLRG